MRSQAAAPRILVSGDLLRPRVEAGALRSMQNENIRWLFRLLRRALGEAAGEAPGCVLWGQGFDTPGFYAACGEEIGIESWARLYAADSLPEGALAVVERAFAGAAAAIAFEMPPVLRDALALLGVPVIDLAIHPVRFGPDIFFAADSSHPDCYAALLGFHVPPRRFDAWADLLAATAAKLGPEELPGDLLVLGQTRGDRSLVEGGRLRDLADAAPALRRLAAAHRGVMFRPHPYDGGDFGLLRAGIPFRRLHRAEGSVYALLAHEELAGVAALSSSVLMEARHFGKSAHALGRLPFRLAEERQDAAPGRQLSLVEGWLDADLWRAALAPVMAVTAPDGHRYRPPANALRLALRNFWGFNEITTDYLVELRSFAAAPGWSASARPAMAAQR